MLSLKKINYRFTLSFLLVLLVFNFLPLFLAAAGTSTSAGLVPCGTGQDAKPTDCQWDGLVKLFNNVIDFIFIDLIVPLAVVALVVAGIQILLAQDKPGQLNKAYGTLRNVGIGMFMSLGAYAIVKTIVSLLARPGSTFESAINKFFGS